MPIEELNPSGQINQAPVKQVPDKDTNIFNARIGQAFKCNICGSKHFPNSVDPIIRCLKKGLQKHTPIDSIEIYPYELSFELQDYRVRSYTAVRIENGILNIYLHHKNVELYLGKEEYQNSIRDILADTDFNTGVKNNLKNITAYNDIMGMIKRQYQLLKDGKFTLTGLDKINWQDALGHIIREFFPTLAFSGYQEMVATEKNLSGDTYLFLNYKDLKDVILLRLSLLYRYLPKIGLWDSIETAMGENPPEKWEVVEQIFFPERMVDINAY